jgi:hypothetical protein
MLTSVVERFLPPSHEASLSTKISVLGVVAALIVQFFPSPLAVWPKIVFLGLLLLGFKMSIISNKNSESVFLVTSVIATVLSHVRLQQYFFPNENAFTSVQYIQIGRGLFTFLRFKTWLVADFVKVSSCGPRCSRSR